jgi:hypothetical protein
LHLFRGESVASHASLEGRSEDFPTLAPGQLHEWFPAGHTRDRVRWHPPLMLLAALALASNKEQPILWIGRICLPMFQVLAALGFGDGVGAGM